MKLLCLAFLALASSACAASPSNLRGLSSGCEAAVSFINGLCNSVIGDDCYSPSMCSNGGRALRALDSSTDTTIDSAALLAAEPERDIIKNRDSLNAWLQTESEHVAWRKFTSSVKSRKGKSVNINYVKITSPAGGRDSKGALVVSVGQSEPVYKYDEFLSEMLDRGFSPIYAIEHRGQGISDRLLEGDATEQYKNHVESSADFVTDFADFVDLALADVAANYIGRRSYMACHSMGCAVAFSHLLNTYNAGKPSQFWAVAANAPLIKADTDPFPYPIATAIGSVMTGAGIGHWFAPTKGKTFEEDYNNAAFSGSTTTSVERWIRHRDRCVEFRNKRIGDDKHLGLCLGGVTGQFATEFFKLYDNFAAFNDGKGRISTPVLIQMAGDPAGSDGLVLNAETRNFYEKSLGGSTNSKLTNYRSSKHNIWIERDEIRGGAMDEVEQWFADHAGAKTAQCPQPAECGSYRYSWWGWPLGCANPDKCSRQFRWGDWNLGMSCRPTDRVC